MYAIRSFHLMRPMLIIGVLLTAGLPIVVSAQDIEASSAKTEKAADSASSENEILSNDILTRINQNSAKLEGYEKRVDRANPEDRMVLQLQIYKLRIQILDDVNQLADALADQEKTGGQPEIRAQVEKIMADITAQLWLQIEHIGHEIDLFRAKRTATKAGDSIALENEITKRTEHLDDYYAKGLSIIEKMQQIGMDVTQVKETFTRLLNQRIDALSGRLELALVRFDELAAQRKETPNGSDIIKRMNAAKINMDTNKKSMIAILGAMESLELDTGTYRAQLLAETRDISSGSLDKDVAFQLFTRSYKNALNWVAKTGPGYIIKLFLFIGILIIFILIARIVRAGLHKALDASSMNLSQLARRMIISTSSKLIVLFGILVALSQWGISLGPLLAGLGIAGFIVGFALQDTLGNFASGMMILLYRPYDVDDFVDVGGIFGKVNKMNLVSTTLLTPDNQLYVMPNSKIWGDVIKNVSAQDSRRIDMVFGISYGDNIPKAESILMDILKSHDLILDTPEPVVHLHTLGDSSVDFIVRPWVKKDDYWQVYWDITRTVKLRFDEEGISIPFPQRDVHLYSQKATTEG